MAEYGIPAPSGGTYDQGPISSQSTGPMNEAELDAPRNPFADRVKVHKAIVARIGVDPYSVRPKNSAKQIEQYLPQLFEQFFAHRGYRAGPNTVIAPEEAKQWEAYVANIYKNAENQETEKAKAIQKAYDMMSKQADADRKQYNALYWKTHPSEERMQSSREKAMTQARQAAVDHMKFMEDKLTGGYNITGPDGKPKKLTPEEASEYFLRKQEEFYRKIAPVYGIKVPEGQGSQAEKVKQWLAKNPNLSLEQVGRALKGVDEKTRAEVLASLPAGQRNILDEVVKGQYGDTARLKKETLASSKEAPDLSVKPDKKYVGGIPKTWLDALSGREEGPNATPPKDRGGEAEGDDEAVAGFSMKSRAPVGEEGAMLSGMTDIQGKPAIPPRTERSEEEQGAMFDMGMTGNEGPETGVRGPIQMLNAAWDWFTKRKPVVDPASVDPAELQRAMEGKSALYVFDPMLGTFAQKPPAELAQQGPTGFANPSSLPAAEGAGYDEFRMPGRSTEIPTMGAQSEIPAMDTAPQDTGPSWWQPTEGAYAEDFSR